jgi:uncharacterized membrane protein
MEFGPIQVVVVGFTDAEFIGKILPELLRLRRPQVIRLVDAIFVSKDQDGSLTPLLMGAGEDPRGDWPDLGEVLGALIGFGAHGEGLSVGAEAGIADGARGRGSDGGEAWAISDAIPAGTSAAVALIEHRWAIPLREAIVRGGGFALEDTWLYPADLLAVGALISDRSGVTTERGWVPPV